MADTRLQNAISNQINGWIVQYGDLVIIKSITPSFDVKNNKRSNSTPNIYDRDISKIEEQLDGITLMITTICKRNQLQKLFLIFRSILYEPTVKKISA